MKTKVDKQAKKRSLSETSLPTKSDQKQKAVTGLKKNPKKAKLVGLVQNGNPTTGNKVQILKKMYKQKGKPKLKQMNIKSEKTEEETKLPIEESVDKKTKIKEKKLKNLEIKQVKREIRKRRKRGGLLHAASITLSIEEIEAKIEEIRNREVLSKRAKKILVILERKLKFEKSALDKSEKSNIIEKKGNKKNKQQVGAFVKIEPEDDEDENDEDQSDTETEESMQNANEQVDDEIDEDEEDEDEEDEDTEDDEDEEDEDTEDDEDEEDDNIKDAEDEEDEDGDEKTNISKIIEEAEKKPKKQVKQSLEHQNKNRNVLFVANLPYNITEDELKQHFLTKVDTVSSVRIPIKSDTKTSRGFAFVEVTNSTDFEKGLSLHNTIMKNRQIIVKPNINKKMNVGKNFGIIKKKPQAFQKAKKLASGNQGKKKPFKKEKQS